MNRVLGPTLVCRSQWVASTAFLKGLRQRLRRWGCVAAIPPISPALSGVCKYLARNGSSKIFT
eukprot:5622539-Pyramimonas_sp.AAC.1